MKKVKGKIKGEREIKELKNEIGGDPKWKSLIKVTENKWFTKLV